MDNKLEQWFEQYGYYVLLIGLIFDFMAIPFPAQTALLYAGYLSYTGTLSLPSIIWLSSIGSATGLTVTYLIGYRAGAPFVRRYGKWVFLNRHNLDVTKRWFDKYGNIILLLSCFVPGFRQVIGYFSGMIRIPYKTFALYMYSGTVMWVSVYASLGYLFGPQWKAIIKGIRPYLPSIIIFFCIVIVLYSGIRLLNHYNGRKAARRK
ncbi:DedA family protein [Paenibacillus tarimensis]